MKVNVTFKFVSFPNDEGELRLITKGFHEISDFPGIIGAIDGTHICIQSPLGGQEPYYVNQKQYHGINVQGICDNEQRFLNIVADWPRSAHNARILICSEIGMEFECGETKGILLGDSRYPCKSWLLTPFFSQSM